MRGLGRLPRHDHFPGAPVGIHQSGAGKAPVRNRRRRAVLHRFALRRIGRMDQRSRGPANRRDQERLLLGLRPHVHGDRVCSARATLRAPPATSSLRVPTPKGASPPRQRSSYRGTQHHARDRAAALEALKARDSETARHVRAEQEHLHRSGSQPQYIKPRMFMFRLQKIMDEYAGGITAQFTTNEASPEPGAGTAGLPEGRLRKTRRRQPA